MKKILALTLLVLLASCSGGSDDEKEDFTPYPGGKGSEQQTPRTSF